MDLFNTVGTDYGLDPEAPYPASDDSEVYTSLEFQNPVITIPLFELPSLYLVITFAVTVS